MGAGLFEIYGAIESSLTASADFTGYNFFRAESEKQIGKPRGEQHLKTKIPLRTEAAKHLPEKTKASRLAAGARRGSRIFSMTLRTRR